MNIIKKLIDYIHSSKNELSKVTWPSKDETIRYSSLVIIISLGAIVFFGMLDYGLNKLVTATLSNIQITDIQEQIPTQPATSQEIQNNLVPAQITTSTATIITTTTTSDTDKK